MNVCTGQLKKKLQKQQLTVCVQANAFRSSAAVELFFNAGYDVLTIDQEHTALGIEAVGELVRVARCLGMHTLVRVATADYDNINRVLDQGADGLFIPRIRCAEEVRTIVKTMRYPPEGIRGLAGYGCPIAKYHGWGSISEQIYAVNNNTVLGIQIETQEALNQLDEILSVPGIDVAVIGCDDLSAALGIPGELENSIFLNAVQTFIDACVRHNIVSGIPCSHAETAAQWVSKGIRMIWYGVDIGLLWEAAERRIQGLSQSLASFGMHDIWK